MTEATATTAVAKGLKGVVAADSAVCHIDGAQGRLIYRGYDIDDLAAHSTFEETSYLLLKRELPNAAQLAAFSAELTEHRAVPAPVLELLRRLPPDTPPMSALRTTVSALASYDPDAEDGCEDGDEAGTYRKAIRLSARMSTLVAAIHRVRSGKDPVAPDPQLGFAANAMWMLNGRKPSPTETRAMDLILILHAEHGFNASTFTARVIAATLTDLYSSIVGAIGALKGKLHGGANTEVIRTLQEIGSIDKVAAWVDDVRARKGKFMGFGHAVYQAPDPRAKHLKTLSEQLGKQLGDPRWYDISVELERRVVAAINRQCNVDFYSASLQHYLGIPGELFTCIFAASRIVGWCAHVLEQLADNKIIRPSSNYVGPAERSYIPIAAR